ncbi:MAG: hypothetical protein ACOC6E_03695 [Thermodesulfobacteriota bacterium]
MKIEELVYGKDDNATIKMEGISIPVRTLKSLMESGYVHLKPEKQGDAITFWGKTRCACFTEEQLQDKA